jgi:hypothetical protein
MMAKLTDVRRRFPLEDAGVYAEAYASAALAGEVGALVYGLRVAAGLGQAGLAERMGIDEDEVLRAEEGDPSLTIAFLDGVARAAGVQVRVAGPAGGVEVVLGRSIPPRAPQPPTPQPSTPQPEA